MYDARHSHLPHTVLIALEVFLLAFHRLLNLKVDIAVSERAIFVLRNTWLQMLCPDCCEILLSSAHRGGTRQKWWKGRLTFLTWLQHLYFHIRKSTQCLQLKKRLKVGPKLAAFRPFGTPLVCCVGTCLFDYTEKHPWFFFSLNSRFWLLGVQWTFEQLKRKISLQLHRRAGCRMLLCLFPLRVYCSHFDSFRCNV